MPGIVWYLCIGIAGLGIASFTLIRKRDFARLIAFYLFAAMIADTGEVVGMVLLQSYHYKLGVSPDYMVENILGHVIPNSTFWPATAILVAAFSLRFRWILAIAFVYMGLDILFIRLGVYQHNWWMTWMTGLAILTYCAVLKFWYGRLDTKERGFFRYIRFSLILCFLIITPTVVLMLAGKELYSIGFYQNKYRDSVVFSVLASAVLSLISVSFFCVLKKWYWKLMPFALFFACDYLLYRMGVLIIGEGWSLLYTMLVTAAGLAAFMGLERKCGYR